MTWTIEITKTAEKQICSFDKTTQTRLVKFLRTLATASNPRQSGKALKGNKAQLWRYRVGDYRVICNVERSHLPHYCTRSRSSPRNLPIKNI